MSLIEFLRLIRKHIALLVLSPVLLASLVYFLTRYPDYTYTSETTLYTGIATGGGIEMSKSFNFFANNTAFDNLINIIKSRNTEEEVGVRLLATHLMLTNYDPKYISKVSYDKFRKLTPPYIFKLISKKGAGLVSKPVVEKPAEKPKERVEEEIPLPGTGSAFHTVTSGESLSSIAKKYGISIEQLRSMNDISGDEIAFGQVLRIRDSNTDENNPGSVRVEELASDSNSEVPDTFTFNQMDSSSVHFWLPQSIDQEAYETTVQTLMDYMHRSDTNFVYKLLNYEHKHYSIKALSNINVVRVQNSDLIKLKYETDDPGICQHTLALFTEVCIRNYKGIKENRSDAIVKYFEYQVKQSSIKLRMAEDKLLKFNKDNNIINYYEQSKAVAVVKEDLDVLYNNKKMVMMGANAAIQRIERQLGNLTKIQLNSSNLLDLRSQLLKVNTKISEAEIFVNRDSLAKTNVAALRAQAEKIKNEIKKAIGELYTFTHNTDGLPINGLLADWLKNVLLYDETKAGLDVLGERIKEFRKQYAIYAPAGANLKRIEREINVSEQAYLELLHGLNLAKLKMQDIELSSNIKAVDLPYFPLSPNPTKRIWMVLAGGLIGFLIVLITILAMEYFDQTLRNPERAARILKLNSAGIFPKVYLNPGTLNFLFIGNRLIEMMIQTVNQQISVSNPLHATKIILFFSTQRNEGKSVLVGNIARKLINQGYKVLVMNFSRESLRRNEISQTGYSTRFSGNSKSAMVRFSDNFGFIKRLLGYPDTRIDDDSPFLESPENYLSPDELVYYQVDETFHSVKNYRELLALNHIRPAFNPEYVLIEIPPILYYPYPESLVASSTLPVLVCRANRSWSTADKGALDNFIRYMPKPPHFLLNGVEIPVVETVLGDLPKKRSYYSTLVKRLVRFQFFER